MVVYHVYPAVCCGCKSGVLWLGACEWLGWPTHAGAHIAIMLDTSSQWQHDGIWRATEKFQGSNLNLALWDLQQVHHVLLWFSALLRLEHCFWWPSNAQAAHHVALLLQSMQWINPIDESWVDISSTADFSRVKLRTMATGCIQSNGSARSWVETKAGLRQRHWASLHLATAMFHAALQHHHALCNLAIFGTPACLPWSILIAFSTYRSQVERHMVSRGANWTQLVRSSVERPPVAKRSWLFWGQVTSRFRSLDP